LTDRGINAPAVTGSSIFAGGLGRVFLPTNAGGGWTLASTGLTGYVNQLVVSGTTLFAGTNAEAFVSTNNGTSWTAVNEGLWAPAVNTLAVSGTYIFAGTYGNSVFRRPLSELVASVDGTGVAPHSFVRSSIARWMQGIMRSGWTGRG
jgi:hypothetical protein